MLATYRWIPMTTSAVVMTYGKGNRLFLDEVSLGMGTAPPMT
jgi:hypothetical protein